MSDYSYFELQHEKVNNDRDLRTSVIDFIRVQIIPDITLDNITLVNIFELDVLYIFHTYKILR